MDRENVFYVSFPVSAGIMLKNAFKSLLNILF